MFEKDYLKTWKQLPVKKFSTKSPPDFKKFIYKLNFSWDSDDDLPLEEQLDKFFALENVSEAQGIILGMHIDDSADDYYEMIGKKILSGSKKLANLKFLFLGEMNYEESELSWIGQGNAAALLEAFPGLEELRVRGGSDYDDPTALGFTQCRHACLEKLVIETISLRKQAFTGIAESVLPKLKHLELWLGSDDRQRTTTVEDVSAFVKANPFPDLKHLSFNNCDIIDEIAIAIAELPLIGQLDTLDLSLGTLTDKGANALLNSDLVKQLKKLDIHHHYLSDGMMTKFKELPIEVDLSERGDMDDFYVSVFE